MCCDSWKGRIKMIGVERKESDKVCDNELTMSLADALPRLVII
jgi:hypothetical protein